MAVSIGTAKPMPTLPPLAAARLDLRVDADHAAGGVEQRAARVARVDRGVGLDDAVDLEAVGRLDRALGGRHDAGGQRALEPERVADRDRRVADLDASEEPSASGVRVEAARGRPSARRGRSTRRGPRTLASTTFLSANWTVTFVAPLITCAFVRIDAVLSIDEARARRLAAALLRRAEVERRLRALDDLGADEDDAGRVALVDLARREAGLARRRRRCCRAAAPAATTVVRLPPPRSKAVTIPTAAAQPITAETAATGSRVLQRMVRVCGTALNRS